MISQDPTINLAGFLIEISGGSRYNGGAKNTCPLSGQNGGMYMYKAKYQDLFENFSVDDIYEDAIKMSDIRSAASMETNMYQEKYDAIKSSIELQGQLEPIILRVLTDTEKEEHGINKEIAYGVLNGRTRLKAIKDLGQHEVLAIVSDVQDDVDDKKTAAITNFARINMAEEDKKAVIDWFRKQKDPKTGKEYTVREVAKMLGISKSYVSKLEKSEGKPADKTEKSEKTIWTIDEVKKTFTSKFIEKITNEDATMQEKEEVTETLKILKNSIASQIKELEEEIKIKKQEAKAVKKNKTK